MGIHQLAKLLGDVAPRCMKENEIKNYFGECTFVLTRNLDQHLVLKVS